MARPEERCLWMVSVMQNVPAKRPHVAQGARICDRGEHPLWVSQHWCGTHQGGVLQVPHCLLGWSVWMGRGRGTGETGFYVCHLFILGKSGLEIWSVSMSHRGWRTEVSRRPDWRPGMPRNLEGLNHTLIPGNAQYYITRTLPIEGFSGEALQG